MERIKPVNFETVENLVTGYQCRASGTSNFEEIGNEEKGWITSVYFKSTYNLFTNYKTEVVESVCDLNDEAIGRITPPANYQSEDNLLLNYQSKAGESILSKGFSNKGITRNRSKIQYLIG